jgi:class 3 adenylate cyclase
LARRFPGTRSSTPRPGTIVIDIQNVTSEQGTFLLVVLPPGFEIGHAPIHFVPFLTGKRLLNCQTFRDLFRSEVIAASGGIGIRDLTLLFTDLKGSTALYDAIGDLNAFALVQQHFDRLYQITMRHGGAVVKTIGDAVMASFSEPAGAVRAAIEMLDEIGGVAGGMSGEGLQLKIGIHRGACVAVTLNDRLDYFGQTVNVAARVQALADASEIYVTRDIYDVPEVAELLSGTFNAEPRLASLRGIHEEVPVFRLRPSRQAPGEPGRQNTYLPWTIPAVARDCTVDVPILGHEIMWKATEKPSISLSNSPRIASTVTSRPVSPVPPVEMIASISARPAQARTWARIRSTSSLTMARSMSS